MNTSKTAIISNIKEILSSNFNISGEILKPDNDKLPLTGNIFDLNAVQMLYLFFEMERLYKVRVPDSKLSSYGFSTIEDIAETIASLANNDDNAE